MLKKVFLSITIVSSFLLVLTLGTYNQKKTFDTRMISKQTNILNKEIYHLEKRKDIYENKMFYEDLKTISLGCITREFYYKSMDFYSRGNNSSKSLKEQKDLNKKLFENYVKIIEPTFDSDTKNSSRIQNRLKEYSSLGGFPSLHY